MQRLFSVNAHGFRIFTKTTTRLCTIIAEAITRLRTNFPSHLFRLRTVGEYLNFTGEVKIMFLVYYVLKIFKTNYGKKEESGHLILSFFYTYFMLLQLLTLKAVTHLF
jgi:hypothetical protein